MSFRRLLPLALAAVFMLGAGVRQASAYTITVDDGLTGQNHHAATAVLTFSAGSLTLTLTNNVADPFDAACSTANRLQILLSDDRSEPDQRPGTSHRRRLQRSSTPHPVGISGGLSTSTPRRCS